jgi:hypothetical protein
MTETGEGLSRKPEKAVTMPEAQQMEQKLTEAGLIGMTEQSDRVFKRFVSSVAGSEKVGAGLAMAWSLANYDELKDYPPQVQAIMGMYFDKVVDTVTPDPEVAQQAKGFMAKVREEARKGR